ncbi:hypothetical protein VMCG_03063 [Cytospora schulzeri]|uniref:AMP-dependent synthetase/ligase domain-containing protein n=1 Tax=Cytospora schulzeri TaxID=448051 RepID=A0A423WYC0_9PEZI|nr:hypothetical protein VMCG_03063 [Valsa malicola]
MIPWETRKLGTNGISNYRAGIQDTVYEISAVKGYYNNEKANEESITPDGWFRTGDLAFLDRNSYLHLDGRSKEMISINGVKHLPPKIDSALEQAKIDGATPRYFCTFGWRDASMDTEVVVVLYFPSYDKADDLALIEGKVVPLQANDPTAKGLTKVMGVSSVKHQYDPVITLQGHGKKTPLWLVHPGVGASMPSRVRHSFPQNLEEDWETYYQAIKKRKPNGPCAIAGYWFGGMSAFEVPKRLDAGGGEVCYTGI